MMGLDCDFCFSRLTRSDRFQAYVEIENCVSPRLIAKPGHRVAEGPLEERDQYALGYIDDYLLEDFVSDFREKHPLERALTINEGVCMDCAFKHLHLFDAQGYADVSQYFVIDFKPRLRMWWDAHEMTISEFRWLYDRVESVERAEVLPLPVELIRIVLAYMD